MAGQAGTGIFSVQVTVDLTKPLHCLRQMMRRDADARVFDRKDIAFARTAAHGEMDAAAGMRAFDAVGHQIY